MSPCAPEHVPKNLVMAVVLPSFFFRSPASPLLLFRKGKVLHYLIFMPRKATVHDQSILLLLLLSNLP